VVGNIFFVDKFLGHTFLNYGTQVIEFSNTNQDDRTDPMIAIFPRMTKCLFHTYGPSGTIQRHDALCILPLNILNEKIFIFLWFWFIILSVLSSLALLYSIAIALYPPIREAVLKRRFKFTVPGGVATIVAKTQVGDFFLLHLLGQNLCSSVFGDILKDLYTALTNISLYPKVAPSFEMTALTSEKDKYMKDTNA
jgi:hypothetical protein